MCVPRYYSVENLYNSTSQIPYDTDNDGVFDITCEASIYGAFDFNKKPEMSVAICIGAIFLVPVSHLCWMGFAKLRTCTHQHRMNMSSTNREEMNGTRNLAYII